MQTGLELNVQYAKASGQFRGKKINMFIVHWEGKSTHTLQI